MTLTDYAYEIMEMLQRNLGDDFEVDIRLVKDMIRDQRELMLYKMAKESTSAAYGSMSQFKQKINLSLSEIVSEDCSSPDCIGEVSRVACSVSEIPETITIFGSPAIYEIYFCNNNDGIVNMFKQKIKFGSKDNATFIGSGRFNSNQIAGFYQDGHICIATKDKSVDIDEADICVYAILKDPLDNPDFNEETDDYPIGKDWVYMQDYIIQKLMRKLMTTEDRINDSTDEIKNNVNGTERTS